MGLFNAEHHYVQISDTEYHPNVERTDINLLYLVGTYGFQWAKTQVFIWASAVPYSTQSGWKSLKIQAKVHSRPQLKHFFHQADFRENQTAQLYYLEIVYTKFLQNRSENIVGTK